MLPPVLVAPPWLESRETGSTSIDVLEVPTRVAWPEGAREAWLASKSSTPRAFDEELLDWLLDCVEAGKPYPEAYLERLDDEALLEFIRDARAAITPATARYAVARLEERALESLVSTALRRLPNTALFSAFEFAVSRSIAELVLRFFARQDRLIPPPEELGARSFEPSDVERWLERFPEEAALVFLPWSTTSDDDAAIARTALKFLAARGHGAAVAAAGERMGLAHIPGLAAWDSLASLDGDAFSWLPVLIAHSEVTAVAALVEACGRPELGGLMAEWLASGTEAETELARRWSSAHRDQPALVAQDDQGLMGFPEVIPSMPAFWVCEDLPSPTLTTGETLPPSALAHLGTMLRFSGLDRPYAGIEQVCSACDAASLDALVVELLARFEAAGAPGTDLWCVYAVALIGGERAVRRLVELIGGWTKRIRADDGYRAGPPREIALVKAAVRVLAAEGSDAALVYLDGMRSGSSGWQRRAAQKAFERAGVGRSIVRAGLEDMSVPTLGLEEDGSMTLDLGERRVRVLFDEQLVPRLFALGSEGEAPKPLRGFPRKRKSEAEAYDDAKLRFRALRDQVKTLARTQIGMLESAMCQRRRWSIEFFRERLVDHPLMWHLARRLVFGAWVRDELEVTFRVADDRSFADEADEELLLPVGAQIGIAHTLEIGSDSLWPERLADYELIQPFEQLRRQVFRREERADTATLAIDEGHRFDSARCFGLTKRGWERRPFHELMSGGVTRKYADDEGYTDERVTLFEKRFLGGVSAWIAISPGFESRYPNDPPTQRLTRVFVDGRLGDLVPIAYSELRHDVAYLRES